MTAAITAAVPKSVKRYCADADLYLNLSGGAWFWRDEYARIPRSAFIDSDPAFTQLAIAKAEPWYVEFFQRFGHLFTFGSNIGTPASTIPVGDFLWHKTWQPVTLTDWRPAVPPGESFTTVMTWQIESFADVGGNKDQEFVKYIDLPARTRQPFELAINGPQVLLREHGWSTLPAMAVSKTPTDYRDFIHRSRAEFGVAKHTYVSSRSGWFSDRTECYLAAGRPALVQDTGWTAHLPSGEGLLSFSSPEEALAGIDRINADYALHARRAARDCPRPFRRQPCPDPAPRGRVCVTPARAAGLAETPAHCASRTSGRSPRRFLLRNRVRSSR